MIKKLKIKANLLNIIVILALIPTMIITVLFYRVQVASFHESINISHLTAVNSVDTTISVVISDMVNLAFVEASGLANYIEAGNFQAIKKRLEIIDDINDPKIGTGRGLGFDMVIITDATGRVLARSDSDAVSDKLSVADFGAGLERALVGKIDARKIIYDAEFTKREGYAHLITDDGFKSLMGLTVQLPVFNPQGKQVGVLIIINKLNNKHAVSSAISSLTQAYFTVYTPNGELISSFFSNPPEITAEIITKAEQAIQEMKSGVRETKGKDSIIHTIEYIDLQPSDAMVATGHLPLQRSYRYHFIAEPDSDGNFVAIRGVAYDLTFHQETVANQAVYLIWTAIFSLTFIIALGLLLARRTQDLQVAREFTKTAEEATRSKSEFLSVMSHEIRTPMNAIIGMTHLVLQTELSTKQQDYLSKSQAAAHSLLRIINDILDFSKMEAGKLSMESVNFNLETVLSDLFSMMSIEATEKELAMHLHIDKDVPIFLIGDHLRLGQILANLTNNAIKFTKVGKIIIKVELVTTADQTTEKPTHARRQQDVIKDKIKLKFSVLDTGIGLSKEQIGRLFQSFSQVDSSITRKFGGTGLGLAISKQLVELMDGDIWIESELDKGSTFIFTAEFEQGTADKSERKKQLLPPEDVQGMNVLVVDNSVTSQKILQSYLQAFSFKVTLASSAKEAIQLLENPPVGKPYKLVLMDWKMPVMDGIKASYLIKKNPKIFPTPAIIMVTAYGREEVIQQAEEAKLDGILLKPVSQSLLFDAIMKAFGQEVMEVIETAYTNQQSTEKNAILKKLRGAKILLAEDNLINQQVASELLEQAGLIVTIANNGMEALQKVSETAFDLVLMDLQMPEMDGYTATQEIRKLESAVRNIPIIAMTAHAMEGVKEECLQAGINDYTTKPIDQEKLFATLIKWIDSEKIVKVAKVGALRVENNSQPNPSSVQELKLVADYLLPGLDIQSGIAAVGGNKSFYLQLLFEFKEQHKNTKHKLRGYLENDDLEAEFMMHSIKGEAGNLTIMKLHAAAKELEEVLKNGEEVNFQVQLNLYENALDQALQSINLLQNQPQVAELTLEESQTPDLDIETITSLMTELAGLLKEGSASAEDCLETLKEHIDTSVELPTDIQKNIKKLANSIDNFDYETAQAVLLQLTQALNRFIGK